MQDFLLQKIDEALINQIMSEKITPEEKARRMADALRENLKRRKQQQRDRDQSGMPQKQLDSDR
ncbi:hypothetical protein [Candidatus Odyssella acanthamoebae]|uniref:hypothetical protein n=1 Tax=Candidatus Odyssella acanthamoebae TaxID=91604 RepID=UPI00094AF89D|nr:hypothetical protein [Candidatus Paracaedibacter acanthamoebae]